MALPEIIKDIEARVKDAGDIMTGSLTMSGTENYISTNWLNNEPSSTNHAIHLGASSRNQVDFYEYGALWNFYKSRSGTNTLVASISENGITASKFIGNLNGNATSATKAIQDGNGAVISSTYLKLTGGTMTGKLAILTNNRTVSFGCDNSQWAHYNTDAINGHWFNKNIYIQGNIYAGTSYSDLVLTSANFNHYTPTLTGSGASGTWGINITGSANQLEGKASSYFKKTWTTRAGKDCVGWIKLIEWKVSKAGHFSPMPFCLSIYRSYYSPAPESYLLSVASNWGNGELTLLNSTYSDRIIEQFRISRSSDSTTYWLEMYVNTGYTTYPNVCYCSVFGYYEFNGTLLSELKQTETVTTLTSILTKTGITASNFNGALSGNAATATVANRAKLLETYYQGSTSTTYGDSYLLLAQWETSSICKLLVQGYSTKVDIANKLATARTISLTGDVTGSVSFDGSKNVSISTTVADNSHSHSYLPLSGGTMSGNITIPNGKTIIQNQGATSNYTTICKWLQGGVSENTYDPQIGHHNTGDTNGAITLLPYSTGIEPWGGTVGLYVSFSRLLFNGKQVWKSGDSVAGAIWNDYAEYRESDFIEPGYCLIENGDDTLSKSTERMQAWAGISSDTWGFAQGQTEKAQTPIAVAGRVLVYPYRDRNEYKSGDCVCTAPDGKVDIMTEEEIYRHPDRIIGVVSCVPDYEEWGGGENADRPSVKVDGRIWVRVK